MFRPKIMFSPIISFFRSLSLSILLLAGGMVIDGPASAAYASGSKASSGTVLILTPSQGDEQELLVTNAETSLFAAGVGIAETQEAELLGFEPKLVLDCLDRDGECSDYLEKAPARWIMLIQLRRSGSDPKNKDLDKTVIAKIYAAKDGSLLQVAQKICKRCSSNERLAAVVVGLVAEVVKAELDRKALDTFIQVNCKPMGAILSIDKTVVGPTGQPYRVKPGDHLLTIAQPGYRTINQPVTVAANENKSLIVNMLPEVAAFADSSGSPWKKYRTAAWPLLGAGVAGIGLGAYYFVVDGDRVSKNKKIRDTKNTAIAATSVGVALAGMGLYWLYATRDAPTETLQISAIPSTAGVSFVLDGSF